MRPLRCQPTRVPRPWDSPGKNTGVGSHFLLQCVKVKLLSHVSLLVTPWTAAYQAPPSMGFSRQEYGSGIFITSQDSNGLSPSVSWASVSFSCGCCNKGHRLSSLKQQDFVSSQFQRPDVWNPGVRGHGSFSGLQGRCFPCCYSRFYGSRLPWLAAASYPSLPPSARGLLFLYVSPPSVLSIIRTGVHGLRIHLDSPGWSYFVIPNDICKTFPTSRHSWVPGRYIFWWDCHWLTAASY